MLRLTRTLIARARRALVDAIYGPRQVREVNPEGDFDNAGRWSPSARENAGGSGTSTRSPSRAWPYSYMLRCRTRQHAAVLLERALAGRDVPPDVAAVLASAERRIAEVFPSDRAVGDGVVTRAEIAAAILAVLEGRIELPSAHRKPAAERAAVTGEVRQ